MVEGRHGSEGLKGEHGSDRSNTRAVKICRNASLDGFMRALQLHILEHVVHQFCISNLESKFKPELI